MKLDGIDVIHIPVADDSHLIQTLRKLCRENAVQICLLQNNRPIPIGNLNGTPSKILSICSIGDDVCEHKSLF